MKKLLALFLIFAMVLSFVACQFLPSNNPTPDESTGDSSGDGGNNTDGGGTGNGGNTDGGNNNDGNGGNTDGGNNNDGNGGNTDGGNNNDGNGGNADGGNTGSGSDGKSHKDEDNNGLCDICNESVVVVIDFYAINDLHGKLFDNSSQPGVDELTTYLKNAKASDDYAVILSSGDMWQGTSESNLTHGKMMTEWMNSIGVVSMTLGNHEFDWSNQYIYDNGELADFPILAINIYNTTTGKPVDFAKASTIVQCGNAKIGIIGAIGNCLSSISGDKVMNMEFKVGTALANLVKAEADRLRAEGCDYIVYSVHDGAESGGSSISDSAMSSYYDIALSRGYIDLVFEAHTHQEYVMRDSAGVYHIQAGGENRAISHVEIQLNYANDTSKINVAETIDSYTYDDCAKDDIINELKEKYKDDIAKGEEYLGTISRYVDGDDMRQKTADLYLEKGLEKWGSKYNIVLGGGFVSVRAPYNLYAGDVYYKDLYSIFPFDNGLYLCSISGSNLKSKFINTTNSNYFICMSDYGNSITINNNSTYYIIADAYSVFYAANKLTIVEEYGEELFARDLLAEYIKNGGYGATYNEPGTDNDDSTTEVKFSSIPDIVAEVNALGANVQTSKSFYLLGKIIDEPNATYGNCTIQDADGNTIFVYGMYDTNGTRYDSLATKPKKGDTIIVRGTAMLYVNQSNTADTKVEIVSGVVESIFYTSDISEALEAGEALANNATTTEQYTICGKVKDTPNQTYGNTTVTDANGDEIYVYGLYTMTGNVLYGSMSIKPEQGDTIIVTGYVKKYVKTGSSPIIEFEKGYVVLLCKADGSVYYL